MGFSFPECGAGPLAHVTAEATVGRDRPGPPTHLVAAGVVHQLVAAGVQRLAGVDGVQDHLVTYDHLQRKGPGQLFTRQVRSPGGRAAGRPQNTPWPWRVRAGGTPRTVVSTVPAWTLSDSQTSVDTTAQCQLPRSPFIG